PDDSDPQLSSLYHTAPAGNPPAHLDAAIQAAARRAVGARPQSAGASLLRAWRVPLSIAAVLVMSVGMVTLTVRQKGGQLMEPEQPYTASVPAPRSEPPVIPVPSVTGTAVAEQEATRATKHAAELAAVAPAAVQPPRAFSTPVESAAPAKQEHAAAPAAPELAASAEGRIARRDRADSGMPAAAMVAAPPVSILIREFEKQPPAKWLEKIADLRQQGKIVEADELLAEFRKRYPNHPLPSASR
ncbi:MAG: hypothetical protein AABZ67_08975, partial [Pseudomonadota bacterium]